ncbi:TlpA disulfide reductase family protein [Nocardioides sp. C4-1]|uniref:TlpA family protein disulfide reductase n=1 Tax=Nocardioides sp. C4-1 TaxID=3151851 RepID=UPI0032672280
MRRVVGAVVALLALTALSGCSGLSGTDDVNYRTDGAGIVQVDPDDRAGPVDIAGTTLDGDELDLADLRGGVVVLNVWGSWCTPCRDEAPVLKLASEELDAEFVGLSFRETSSDNARSFEREYGIEYPTITDEEQVLELGRFVPRTPPSTYVLDAEGRVAAVITGAVTSSGTLEDVVTEVADGG